MAKLDNSTKAIYYSIVESFFKTNANLFTEYEQKSLLYHLKHGDFPDVYYKDSVREVLDYLGLIPDDANLYKLFLNELCNHFDIENKNIIEVGGGVYPNLARRISLKQNKGTITVFDPRLDPSYKSTDKMILIKDKFSRETSLDDIDLLIGLKPCKGIDPLIDQAIEHKKDFMVWFCEGGPHGDYFDYFEDDDEWYHCMMVTLENGVERQNMGKVKKIEYPAISKYPIVYNSKE